MCITPLLQRLLTARQRPYGEKWQKELEHLIRQADLVIWLVSPASIHSRWCAFELQLVQRAPPNSSSSWLLYGYFRELVARHSATGSARAKLVESPRDTCDGRRLKGRMCSERRVLGLRKRLCANAHEQRARASKPTRLRSFAAAVASQRVVVRCCDDVASWREDSDGRAGVEHLTASRTHMREGPTREDPAAIGRVLREPSGIRTTRFEAVGKKWRAVGGNGQVTAEAMVERQCLGIDDELPVAGSIASARFGDECLAVGRECQSRRRTQIRLNVSWPARRWQRCDGRNRGIGKLLEIRHPKHADTWPKPVPSEPLTIR